MLFPRTSWAILGLISSGLEFFGGILATFAWITGCNHSHFPYAKLLFNVLNQRIVQCARHISLFGLLLSITRKNVKEFINGFSPFGWLILGRLHVLGSPEWSKIQSLCPTITGNVCCTEAQFETLRAQVQQVSCLFPVVTFKFMLYGFLCSIFFFT